MRAFKGLRVIDFTRALSGPMAAQMLALLDADVVKVEPPGEGDQLRGVLASPEMAAQRLSPAFPTGNLRKRSLALDLKSEIGREAAGRLVSGADVVIENFVPEPRRNSASTTRRFEEPTRMSSIVPSAGMVKRVQELRKKLMILPFKPILG
jgi:hypothetical protein